MIPAPRFFALLSASALALCAPARARAQAPAAAAEAGCAGVVDREAVAMGTRVHVRVCPAAPGEAGARAAAAAASAVLAELDRLEGLWSTFRPDSDVSRLNAAAGRGPVKIAPETVEVLKRARDGSARTAGLFDVTFAPLGALWRFDTPPGSHAPTKLDRVPSAAEVKDELALVGWRGLRIDEAARTAALDRPGMAVHLGGIGKGAAVDRAVALLRARGLRDFVVQAGGDLYCAGTNGPRPWRIGIAHPRVPGAIVGRVEVRDAAFSTSGDYERFAILDGTRYHHILDPRTGFPATASQSATVLAKTATDCEVLTKAAFIAGGADGLALVERAGALAVIVDADGRVHASRALRVEAP